MANPKIFTPMGVDNKKTVTFSAWCPFDIKNFTFLHVTLKLRFSIPWCTLHAGSVGPSQLHNVLTFTALWANSVDKKLVIFFYFSPETGFWRFVQFGDNLHEMWNYVSLEKQETYFKMSSAENVIQSAKRKERC